MRFNPPPNWPRLPDGWSPPPGWQPDPSWPQQPPGWPLWIADDEFVISPGRSAATHPWPARSAQPWYRQTAAVVLFLIFFFPVGLVLLWLRSDWSPRRRGAISAVVGIVAIFAIASQSTPPTTTTVLSPTAIGTATAVAVSPTPPASPSPSPSPVTTPPPAPLPSSVPPSTAAAAPVHTSAAPVHTTKAPQPVKTTAQAQGCYPLTDGGNCYKPGEFCRTTDHGKTGIDANGDPIKCVDNDRWRWEPA